ncbi:MAG TPA: RagB/SusD family nutrient uptake outer membrane protein [Mucilaginibacter sp.]|jgi:hypothetical protein
MKTIYQCFSKKSRALWLGALGLFLLASCTKNFEKYNTNPNAVTEAQLKGDGQNIGGFFPDMETSIMRIVDWEYQVQQNLNADFYSGYMMSADPFGGNNNTTYALRADWNTYAFDEPYQHVMSNWLQIKTRGQKSNPDFYAVALILKVEAAHRVADIFGPMPYTKFGSGAFSVPYDSQQGAYTAFFAELDTAVNNLTAYDKANPGATPFIKFDLIYGGDYKQWIKFANTLRLRLAMHIVYADAATAQKQAEAAVANSYGLLSAASDDALVNAVNGITYQNPLATITHSWGDVSEGAPLESILEGYNDPRLAAYCQPSKDNPAKMLGIRLGVSYSGVTYGGFSQLNIALTDKIRLMEASESFFLRAEGALRGWNMGGTAQSFYNAGIALAFQERGVNMPGGYLTDATSTAAAYVDPQNSADNIPAGSPYLNNVTILLNPADPFETNLQRIITQKWIAMFPDGQEAWTEYRRTGYPVLFPVINNNSNGTINSVLGIRRLPFASSEVSNNSAEVQKALSLLGGPDNGGTKLWWDKNPNH